MKNRKPPENEHHYARDERLWASSDGRKAKARCQRVADAIRRAKIQLRDGSPIMQAGAAQFNLEWFSKDGTRHAGIEVKARGRIDAYWNERVPRGDRAFFAFREVHESGIPRVARQIARWLEYGL